MWVGRRSEVARFAFAHELGQATDPRRDDRTAEGVGGEHDPALEDLPVGDHDDVGCAEVEMGTVVGYVTKS